MRGGEMMSKGVGTSIGQTQVNQVSSSSFERESSRPNETVELNYRSMEVIDLLH
jgi:hypothetical protein